ncbi:peptide-methionine (S)-S-oxide reductase MsrA [Neptunicoccus cionae]|uniref:peptide-methionine (S)-S-oxide reductase MsrA n=1 Tax=Neptunicoccus cionae TaxID=2035344 RepID=UPI000C767299|nr:peptide-methionine (S)-S-oxide reductase MsrA [Amylibacter cionae]PLS22874.1 peptide-methionine (S)-S-oxide reductase [Amylibacter cionae]
MVYSKHLLRLIAVTIFAGVVPLKAAVAEDAIFAGGCFWCVESDFESLPGVIDAQSGYIGGPADKADYKTVSKGGTGHYEAVLIRFDPAKISYASLLHKFWRSVDPTDAGGQFCDRGDSYRTAVFPVNAAQEKTARASKAKAEAALGQRIVTPILKAPAFYPAEAYHQDYYKSSKKVLTRFGLVKRKDAYKKYRDACGRDQRIRALWGAEAHSLPNG